jgi:hypothetical protein
MSAFALYTSRGSQLPDRLLSQHDSKPQEIEFGMGPDGAAGTFHFWVDNSRPHTLMQIVYNPKIQDWTQISQTLWIGVEKDRPVEPTGIERLEQYISLPVTLADGQLWKVPITARLPRTWGVGLDGSLQRNIRPEFREYCELSESVWNMIVNEQYGDDRVQLPRAWEYCCRALALNYRVTPAIVSHLGLIDDTVVGKVLAASVELEQIVEVAESKKNEQDPACTPDT